MTVAKAAANLAARGAASMQAAALQKDHKLALACTRGPLVSKSVCEKSSFGLFFRFEAMEHQVDHGDVDHVLAALRQLLVVFAQPTVTPEPGKSPLDYPATRQNGKTFLTVRTLDDFQGPFARCLHP